MKQTFLILAAALMFAGCSTKTETKMTNDKSAAVCSEECEPGKNLTCKLTSRELQERRETVLTSLRKQVIEKKELKNGYAFRFTGTDKMIDELTEFAKSERQCCDFFTFNLSITGDTSSVWFEITGPKEAKEFIKTEMEL